MFYDFEILFVNVNKLFCLIMYILGLVLLIFLNVLWLDELFILIK